MGNPNIRLVRLTETPFFTGPLNNHGWLEICFHWQKNDFNYIFNLRKHLLTSLWKLNIGKFETMFKMPSKVPRKTIYHNNLNLVKTITTKSGDLSKTCSQRKTSTTGFHWSKKRIWKLLILLKLQKISITFFALVTL